MTDQPPNFDDIFEDDDALEKARKNLDGKTIEGDFANASGARPDENKVRKGDPIITGTGPGPGGFGPRADAEEDTEKKPKDSEPDPEDGLPPNHPRRRLKVRNAFGVARDAVLAIHDRGDHFRIGPRQANGPGPKEISDKQLREILMRCVLEKGWNKIYFYNGNKFDLNTQGRAFTMLASLTRPEIRDDVTGKILRAKGPLADAAEEWRERAIEKANREGKPELAGKYIQAMSIEAVRGRMPTESLPRCFSPGLHERLDARETSMFYKKQNRDWVKDKISHLGFS